MTARDWFGVAARTFALWLLYAGLSEVASILAFRDSGGPAGSAYDKQSRLMAVLDLAAGLFLLHGTDWVVRFAYPDRTPVPSPAPPATRDTLSFRDEPEPAPVSVTEER